jgi:hypothetical protein
MYQNFFRFFVNYAHTKKIDSFDGIQFPISILLNPLKLKI